MATAGSQEPPTRGGRAQAQRARTRGGSANGASVQRGAPAGARSADDESDWSACGALERSDKAPRSRQKRRAAGRRKRERSEHESGDHAGGRQNAGERMRPGMKTTARKGATALPRERSDRSPKRSGGREPWRAGDEGKGRGPHPECEAGRGTPRETQKRSDARAPQGA